MYKTCLEQYTKKKDKGTLTKEYADKQTIYIGIFLMNELLTQEEYQELLDLLKTV